MDLDEARKQAGLNPLPNTVPADPKPEPGHARGQDVTHTTPGQHPELRGIPLVGSGPGCIAGTKPGSSAAALERAGQDILQANLKRNRYQP